MSFNFKIILFVFFIGCQTSRQTQEYKYCYSVTELYTPNGSVDSTFRIVFADYSDANNFEDDVVYLDVTDSCIGIIENGNRNDCIFSFVDTTLKQATNGLLLCPLYDYSIKLVGKKLFDDFVVYKFYTDNPKRWHSGRFVFYTRDIGFILIVDLENDQKILLNKIMKDDNSNEYFADRINNMIKSDSLFYEIHKREKIIPPMILE